MNEALPVVDDLMTDGCANCAMKHLSSALASLALMREEEFVVPFHEIIAGQALLNLVEAAEGYTSHRDFAIGLLAYAELLSYDEECAHSWERSSYPSYREYRRIRVALMTGDDKAVHELTPLVTHEALFAANLKEASRELPGDYVPNVGDPQADDLFTAVRYRNIGQHTANALVEAIKLIREEFFAVPTVGEAADQEGDKTMTKKAKCAPGKCADDKGGKTAKGAQADCKGGKCKGGKSCKK